MRASIGMCVHVCQCHYQRECRVGGGGDGAGAGAGVYTGASAGAGVNVRADAGADGRRPDWPVGQSVS